MPKVLPGSYKAKPMKRVRTFLHDRKFECLLFALLMHLFDGVFFIGLDWYTHWVWPFNMALLGVASYGIFYERSLLLRILKNLFFAAVAFSTLIAVVLRHPSAASMTVLNVSYVAFYLVVFAEVLRFIARPGYINTDLIVAAICGYLLLIEIGVFLFQFVYYTVPFSFRNIDSANNTTVFADLVYYCTVTVTSIGFGDIVPAHHLSKFLTALLGIAGQFYIVVLVGVIISKYTAHTDRQKES